MNRESFMSQMRRDPAWVKARIAARILLRVQAGRVLARDARLAHSLANDPDISDRLIDQALACLCAESGKLNYQTLLPLILTHQPKPKTGGVS